jgi:parvulin-like peptidyl-prolyl isomerase
MNSLKKFSCLLIASCLTFLFVANSCQKNETAVAAVGNSKLTKKEIAVQVPAGAQLTKDNINTLIDKWTNTELLYQEAKRMKIDKNETLLIQLKQVEKEMLVNKLLEKEMGKITVNPQEIFDYFTKHKQDFLNEVKIARIVVADESLANRALVEIKAGADFTKIAQDISQDRVLEKGAESKYLSYEFGDPSAGGDPSLEEAIFALNPGQVSDVIKSQEGFQIIKLIDKKLVKKDVALTDVKDYINSVVQYRKSREMLDMIINNLKAKTKVTENPDAFFK